MINYWKRSMPASMQDNTKVAASLWRSGGLGSISTMAVSAVD